MKRHKIKIFETRLVPIGEQEVPELEDSKDAAKLIVELLQHKDRENFVLLMMDAEHRVVGMETIAVGTHKTAQIEVPNLFIPLILKGCKTFVLGHNHPMGDARNITDEDLMFTAKITSIASTLGFDFLDHIIVDSDGNSYSVFYHVQQMMKKEGEVARC